MQIQCFGIAGDIVGARCIEIDDDAIRTVMDLRRHLEMKYEDFGKLKFYMIAVNLNCADDGDAICAKDEIAIIPPVSGG